MRDETPIAPAISERFARDGYVKMEQFISREKAQGLRAAIAAEVAAYEAGARQGDPRYIFARTNHILEISNLFNIVAELSDLSLHRQLAATAAQLIDVSSLRVYHDALLYKRSEHPAVPWHQDEFFSVLDGKVITAWMPLVPVDQAGGALVYASGSDRRGLINRDEFGGDAAVSAYIARQGYELCCPSMVPGDVLFHNGHVFHRSEVNRTDTPRIAYSVFLFEDGACIRPPIFGRQDIVDLIYFPGRGVGDRADTALNPVVYVARK